jgi:glycosyltransferase involved in cell wall biosynthesis
LTAPIEPVEVPRPSERKGQPPNGIASLGTRRTLGEISVGRILFLLATLQPGGMETHCVDLAAEFSRRGLAVGVVIPESEDLEPLEARFLAAGAQVLRLDMDARRGRLAQAGRWPKLVQRIRAWRPDVVHVHSGGPSGGLALIAAARCAGSASVILTEHNPPSETLPKRQRIFRTWMDRWCHRLVAVSRQNGQLRADLLGAPSEKFAVVLNGVPIRLASPEVKNQHRLAIRSQLGIGPNTVVIGSVVRLVEGKGLDDLLRALAIVRRACASELLLVGDGPLRGEVERLCRSLDIGDSVHLVGQQDDPYPFLDAMDLFVLAVPSGSMSIALLEAMSRGVASVITFGGPEEALIHEVTGLAAPPNDPAGLARVLVRGAGDPALRSRLATAGAAHVLGHFSVQRVADDLLDLYATAQAGTLPLNLRFDTPPHPRAAPGTLNSAGSR